MDHAPAAFTQNRNNPSHYVAIAAVRCTLQTTIPNAEQFAGSSAFILSGERTEGLAAQFPANGFAGRDVERSCAVFYSGAGINRPVQALLYCAIATDGPAYGRRELNRRSEYDIARAVRAASISD